jgi:hypothetical protein
MVAGNQTISVEAAVIVPGGIVVGDAATISPVLQPEASSA